MTVTDNKDVEKVLATIAFVVRIFVNRFPDAAIIFRGSTASRTRLYAIKLSRYLDAILPGYDLLGSMDGLRWESFKANSRYQLYKVKLKQI